VLRAVAAEAEMSKASNAATLRNALDTVPDLDALASQLHLDDIDAAESPLAIALRAPRPLPIAVQKLVTMTTHDVLASNYRADMRERVGAGHRNQILTDRVTQHLTVEERLAHLSSDVADSLGKGQRTSQALTGLESRILRLRGLLRAADATVDVDIYGKTADGAPLKGKGGADGKAVPSAESVVQAELEASETVGSASLGMSKCPKCARVFLSGFVRRHLEECDGTGGGESSSEEEGDEDDSDHASSDEEEGEEGGSKKPSAKALKKADAVERMAALAAKRSSLRDCHVCLRKFDAKRLVKHVEVCKMKADRAAAKASALAELPKDPVAAATLRAFATPPKAPGAFRALAATCTSIPLVWNVPLFDGGSPILEYEVEYSANVETRVSRREVTCVQEPQPSAHTTCWIMAVPVAHRGYTLTGLVADREYVSLRVRALNQKGSGDWSAVIKSVRTTGAVAPTAPLHFRLDPDVAPSSSSFTVQWEPPLDTGGDKIASYDVRYTEQVPDFPATMRARALSRSRASANGSTSDLVTVPAPRSLLVRAESTSAVISGLPGPAAFTDVHIVALSSTGAVSAPSVHLPVVRTTAMTREARVRYDLAALKTVEEVETYILDPSGSAQVVNRLEHIGRLEVELDHILTGKGLPPEPRKVAEVPASALPPKRQEEADIRRGQFDTRLATLASRIHEVDVKILRAGERRTQLKHLLVSADRRWRVLLAENEHVKNFKGVTIDSKIMHGRSQRFPVASLRTIMREEMDEVAYALVAGKREMILVAEELVSLRAGKAKIEEQVRERKSAFMAFEKAEARAARASVMVARLGAMALYRCFASWKAGVEARKRARANMVRFVARFENQALASAFSRWAAASRSDSSAIAELAAVKQENRMVGLGSALLIAAEAQRIDASEDAIDLLSWLRRVEGELDAADASLAHRKALKTVNLAVIAPIGGPAVRAAMAAATADAAKRAGIVGPRSSEGYAAAPGVTQPLSVSLDAVGEARTAPAPALRLVDEGAGAGLNLWEMKNMALGAGSATNSSEARMIADISLAGVRGRSRAAAVGASALESKGPDAVLAGALGADVETHARSLLARAEAYLRVGQHEHSLLALKRAEMVYGWRKDALGLLAVYRLLARLLEAVGRFDVGCIHWERVLGLAREPGVDDVGAVAEAHEGRGRCLSTRGAHEDALLAFERAEDVYTSRGDAPAIARVLRLEASELMATGRGAKADEFTRKANAIDRAAGTAIARGIARLFELENDLLGQGISSSVLIPIEAVGPAVPLLRQQLAFIDREVFKLRAVARSTQQVLERETQKYSLIEAEAVRAEASTERTLETRLLQGVPMIYEVTELRMSLRGEQRRVAEVMNDARVAVDTVNQRIANVGEEAGGLQDYLRAETRDLSKLAHSRTPLRCAAVNTANVLTNHVLGSATGGVPRIAAACESQAFAYSTLTGELEASFVGDSDKNPVGAPLGHTKTITAIAFYKDIVYTGSQDCTVRAWATDADRGWGKYTPIEVALETQEKAELAAAVGAQDEAEAAALEDGIEFVRKPVTVKQRDPQQVRRLKAGLLLLMEGHTGSVTALAVNHKIIVSGSSDKMIMVWNAKTGALLRRLRGHEYSITSLALDELTFASGGADRDVRLWRIERETKKNPAAVVKQAARLRGHSASVTCVAISGEEVVSGAANGEIIVWNTQTQTALRTHQAHTLGKPVFCLQFDAVKIVSAGADAHLVFTDLITGDALSTTVRPHGDAHVLTLCFDSERLVTIAADRTMRVWAFKGGEPLPLIKEHVIAPREKAAAIARKYKVKVKDLLQWNGMTDVRNFYEGQRIIVAPPPGTKAYEEAEAGAGVQTGSKGGDAGRSAEADVALVSAVVLTARSEVSNASATQAALSSSASPSRFSSLTVPDFSKPVVRTLANVSRAGAAARAELATSGVNFSAVGTGEGPNKVPIPVDPVSTTVGAGIILPHADGLLAKALGVKMPVQKGLVNPTSSPYGRHGGSGTGDAGHSGIGLVGASSSGVGAAAFLEPAALFTEEEEEDSAEGEKGKLGGESIRVAAFKAKLAANASPKLGRGRSVRAMAAANAMRLPFESLEVARASTSALTRIGDDTGPKDSEE